MPKQRFTTEEIIHKLHEADVWIGQGKTVADACKQLGITDKTYFGVVSVAGYALREHSASMGRDGLARSWLGRHP